MDHSARIDTLARFLGRTTSRRRFLGGVAATGLVATGAIGFPRLASAQTSADDASNLVQQYYSAIDAYQYADAYAMRGTALQKEQSQADYIKGFGDTAFVGLEITGTANGNNGNQVVNVNLTSWLNDGSISAYTGSYTVGAEGGNTVLLAADIAQGANPTNVPALCSLSDLTFELGAWDAGAGSRMTTVIATNTGADTCVVGGNPRLILTYNAKGDELVSSSEAGEMPTAISVDPGKTATAAVQSGNWCEDASKDATLGIEIPGDTGEGDVDFSDNGISYPPCNGAGQDALLGVRAWTAS